MRLKYNITRTSLNMHRMIFRRESDLYTFLIDRPMFLVTDLIAESLSTLDYAKTRRSGVT
jgi:hypothetical protein